MLLRANHFSSSYDTSCSSTARCHSVVMSPRDTPGSSVAKHDRDAAAQVQSERVMRAAADAEDDVVAREADLDRDAPLAMVPQQRERRRARGRCRRRGRCAPPSRSSPSRGCGAAAPRGGTSPWRQLAGVRRRRARSGRAARRYANICMSSSKPLIDAYAVLGLHDVEADDARVRGRELEADQQLGEQLLAGECAVRLEEIADRRVAAGLRVGGAAREVLAQAGFRGVDVRARRCSRRPRRRSSAACPASPGTACPALILRPRSRAAPRSWPKRDST